MDYVYAKNSHSEWLYKITLLPDCYQLPLPVGLFFYIPIVH